MRTAFALLLLTAAEAHALDQASRVQVMRSVVFLVAMEMKGDRMVPVSRGSGTIISTDGTILTNYHVIADKEANRRFSAIAVGFTHDFDQAPVFTCIAFPRNARASKVLDLALLRCETNMQGGPLPPQQTFPAVPLGDSSTLVPGDDVYIIGYPGIGGTTINYTAGKVSGFTGEDNQPGRDWIKTDASLAGGNSGGAAIDEHGQLVGVPTRIGDIEKRGQFQIGQVNYLRPVNKARTLMVTADAEPPAATTSTAATTTPATPDPLLVVPPPAVKADPIAEPPPRTGKSSGGSGMGFGRLPVQEERDEGVTVEGRIVAADSGLPLAGAIIIFLRPGIKIRTVREDNLVELMLTKGIADSRGHFTTEQSLPRGASFGVVVLATGFRSLGADGAFATDATMSASHDVGPVRLQRR